MTEIYLGMPPANIAAWISAHAEPTAKQITVKMSKGGTVFETVVLTKQDSIDPSKMLDGTSCEAGYKSEDGKMFIIVNGDLHDGSGMLTYCVKLQQSVDCVEDAMKSYCIDTPAQYDWAFSGASKSDEEIVGYSFTSSIDSGSAEERFYDEYHLAPENITVAMS